jgi:hypothetical protein
MLPIFACNDYFWHNENTRRTPGSLPFSKGKSKAFLEAAFGEDGLRHISILSVP